ncbi:MAG: hypothetical protein AB3X41_10885 [Leptothrix ochracea]|uniref:hypothetical protein n=1 Tax=Leptothrix ochracea TaxID=735331 RepID=UPI0034E2BA8B
MDALIFTVAGLAVSGLAWGVDRWRTKRQVRQLEANLETARAAAAQFAVQARQDLMRLEREMRHLRPLQVELEHAQDELNRLRSLHAVLDAGHSPGHHYSLPSPDAVAQSMHRPHGFADTLPLR